MHSRASVLFDYCVCPLCISFLNCMKVCCFSSYKRSLPLLLLNFKAFSSYFRALETGLPNLPQIAGESERVSDASGRWGCKGPCPLPGAWRCPPRKFFFFYTFRLLRNV